MELRAGTAFTERSGEGRGNSQKDRKDTTYQLERNKQGVVSCKPRKGGWVNDTK